jgi:hypothetical protein
MSTQIVPDLMLLVMPLVAQQFSIAAGQFDGLIAPSLLPEGCLFHLIALQLQH